MAKQTALDPTILIHSLCLLCSVLALWSSYAYYEAARHERVDSADGLLEVQEWVKGIRWTLPAAVTLTYLAFVWFAPSIKGSSSWAAPHISSIMAWYNFAQVAFNAWLAWCFVTAINNRGQPWWGDKSASWHPHIGALFYLYYLNKIADLSDTLFIIVSGKKDLTFLHVVHHIGQLWFTYIVVATFPRGDNWFPAALNCVIHAQMYLWYLLSRVGVLAWLTQPWKRILTATQLLQFVCLMAHNINAGFIAQSAPIHLSIISLTWMIYLFSLFAKFFRQAYGERERTVSTSISKRKKEFSGASLAKNSSPLSWGAAYLLIDSRALESMFFEDGAALSSWIRDFEQNGFIEFGRGYATGKWDVDPSASNVDDVLYSISRRVYGNIPAFQKRIPYLTGLRWYLEQRNRGVMPPRSTRNRAASEHYNLSSQVLWDTMLDPESKSYTCGHFSDDSLELGAAQLRKVDYYLDEVMQLKYKTVKERQEYCVLDVGAGWGNMVNRIAHRYPEVKVYALTHSEVQSREYHPSVRSIIADMIDGEYGENRFDFVNMTEIEHVGRNNYTRLMIKINRALKRGGIYVMQSLNTPMTYPYFMDEFIDTYIFPGGYLPSVALLAQEAENAGLRLMYTCEWDPRHYEITFESWRRRFASNEKEIAAAIGEETSRAFRLYLSLTQFTLEARGFIPHTMIYGKRRGCGFNKLFPKGIAPVPAVGVPNKKLEEWLSSQRKLE